jgi:rod shape-determining protein MreD
MSESDATTTSTSSPPLRAVGPATPRPRGRTSGNGLGWVAAMVVAAVLLEVSVMPYVNVARGIPDLIAPTIVVIAVLRGSLVGAVAGFCAGLLVELTAPVGTLGVMALLYLAVGAWCGRYCEREESASVLAPLALSVVAVLAVQVGYLAFQLLLGNHMPASELVGQVIFPTVALTALLSSPILLVGRRLLGAPRVVEPYILGG